MAERFEIDLMDQADIERKLPEARAILQAKEAAAHDAAYEVSRWAQLVDHLEQLSRLASPTAQALSNGNGHPPTKEAAAIAILTEHGRGMRPGDVYEKLRERGIDVAGVNATNSLLYTAMKKGLIARYRKGVYGPLIEEGNPKLLSEPVESEVASGR